MVHLGRVTRSAAMTSSSVPNLETSNTETNKSSSRASLDKLDTTKRTPESPIKVNRVLWYEVKGIYYANTMVLLGV